MTLATVTVYGEGGYAPDLPGGNIIEQYDVADPPQTGPDVTHLAQTLSTLPQTVLDDLIAALGLT